jgi:hypothetical protein
MRPIALVLVVLGIVALIYGGISYNRQKTVFEIGGIKATTTEHKDIPIAPIVGVIAIVGGVAILVVDKRRV